MVSALFISYLNGPRSSNLPSKDGGIAGRPKAAMTEDGGGGVEEVDAIIGIQICPLSLDFQEIRGKGKTARGLVKGLRKRPVSCELHSAKKKKDITRTKTRKRDRSERVTDRDEKKIKIKNLII